MSVFVLLWVVSPLQNPEHKGQPSRGNVPSAGPFPAYTEEQKQQFAGRSWISVTDTTLLDVAGTELLLVGARDDPIGTGKDSLGTLTLSLTETSHRSSLQE